MFRESVFAMNSKHLCNALVYPKAKAGELVAHIKKIKELDNMLSELKVADVHNVVLYYK